MTTYNPPPQSSDEQLYNFTVNSTAVRALEYFHLQVFKIDVIIFTTLIVYVFSDSLPDREIPGILMLQSSLEIAPRFAVELTNLVLMGFYERWLVLPMFRLFDSFSVSLRFGEKLPLDENTRDEHYKQAQQKPWLHNKVAFLFSLCFLTPWDLFVKTHTDDTLAFSGTSLKAVFKKIIVGLLVMDVILGTAHLACHKGPLKKILFKYHAHHHTQRENFAAVKYVGNPFDLEVFLTQVCYAFLPRVMGMNVWTGILLTNVFSMQLLFEHTGYKIFHLSQHHQAHHRFGKTAFYHFPIVELFLSFFGGKLPSLEQLRKLDG